MDVIEAPFAVELPGTSRLEVRRLGKATAHVRPVNTLGDYSHDRSHS
jgi:hypothetical protein